MSYGKDFVLTLFTNDPDLARLADAAGIDRIGVDLETIGKSDRQDGLKTWVSDHEVADLPGLSAVLERAHSFVRTNPVHAGIQSEVDCLVGMGVKVLMLPYFKTVVEAETFIDAVAGRAQVSLLLETAAAASRIADLVRVPGIDEIHIGLNDLHLSLGLSNHFELLVSPLLEMLSIQVRSAGIRFGFGGIGRLGDPSLPVPADLVYAQYPRLHADRALVSRVFVTPDYRQLDLAHEVQRFRQRIDEWHAAPKVEREAAREALRELASGYEK